MSRRVLIAVGAITLLGALLRFPTLDAQSFWSDEKLTEEEGVALLAP